MRVTLRSREGRRRGTNGGHAEIAPAREGRRRGTNEGHAETTPAREGRRRGTNEGHAKTLGSQAALLQWLGPEGKISRHIFSAGHPEKRETPRLCKRKGTAEGRSHLEAGEGEF